MYNTINKFLSINIVAAIIGVAIALYVIANTSRNVIYFLVVSSPYVTLLFSYPLAITTEKTSKFNSINLLITLIFAVIAIAGDNPTGIFTHVSSLPMVFISAIQCIFVVRRLQTINKTNINSKPNNTDTSSAKNRFFQSFFAITLLHAIVLFGVITSGSATDLKVIPYWATGTFLMASGFVLLWKKINYTTQTLLALILSHIALAYLAVLTGTNALGASVNFGITIVLLMALLIFYFKRVR